MPAVSASPTRGVIASGDVQSAEAGASILDAGGNAVDAVVAAALAAFVCELPLCGPLGGAVATVWPAQGEPMCMDAFARAPGLGGTPPEALDFEDVEVDFGAATQVFHIGRGSAAVPLAISGLLRLHEEFGRMPLPAIAEPAVALGRTGYVLSAGIAFANELLEPIFSHTPACRELVCRGQQLAKAGERLDNVRLADTLEAVCRDPAIVADLYRGLVKEFGVAAGGRIDETDIAQAEVGLHTPVRVPFGPFQIASPPAPSMGGVLIALGARLLEGAAENTRALSAADVLQLATTQDKLLAQRSIDFDLRIREPEFVRALLSDENVAALRNLAATDLVPDNPLGSTTQLSVIDRDGLAVALTLTNGEGCGYVLSDTGIIVNNLLGEEDIHPRGFHHDPPGSSLSTMMAPTVIRRAGQCVAMGSGGSNRLRNAILQVIHLLLGHGLQPQVAVEAPRIHIDRHADGGARVAYERVGMSEAAEAALIGAFPKDPVAFDARNMYFGGVHVALVRDGQLEGGGDPRRGGCVRVV